MNYRGILAFIFILLLGIPTGANNLLMKRDRSIKFTSRISYCEQVKQRAEIFQDHSITPFKYFPSTLHKSLQHSQWYAQNHLTQVKQLLVTLTREKVELAQSPSHNEKERQYQSWRLEHEIPQQIVLLEEQMNILEKEIENNTQHQLTEKALLDLYTQTYYQDFDAIRSSQKRKIAQVTTLPFMGIEVELEEKFLNKFVKLYPVWIEGNQISRASEEPYLILSDSMIPLILKTQFTVDSLHNFFTSHSDFKTHPKDAHHLIMHKAISLNQNSKDWALNQLTGLSDPTIRKIFDLDCQNRNQ